MRTTRRGWITAFVGVGLVLLAVPTVWALGGGGGREQSPLVIGHRGAAGYLPDHTLEGYALAIKLGADYIEPDLVATKDGHLIARHEPNITSTTDVASHPEFAGRQTTEDRRRRRRDRLVRVRLHARRDQDAARGPAAGRAAAAVQRPLRDPDVRARSSHLAKRWSKKLDRQIGVYPETKHPTYHADLGLPLEHRLVKVLRRAGWNNRHAPVFIQSFEQSNLKLLNRLTPVRLVQLVDANDVDPDGTITYAPPFDRPYDWTVSGDPELQSRTFGFFATDAGLEEISTYADGIGPWKPYIVSSRAIA